MTAFQLFEENLALLSYYIAKQKDFPKIVQLNRKCVNSFDANCILDIIGHNRVSAFYM